LEIILKKILKLVLLIIDGKGKIIIGNHVIIGLSTVLRSANKIFIGNNVLISSGVYILDHNSHPLDSKLRQKDINNIYNESPQKFNYKNIKNKPIIISDNVWIGRNALILKGVTIGKNSIIGANTTVTKSIPKNSIAVGNPAIIKKLAI